MNIQSLKHVYFIGIGGIGMSAIARYFYSLGIKVSGYDKTLTELTSALVEEGMNIHFDDNEKRVPEEVDLVVYTPAIPADHLGLQLVKKKGIPLMKRAQAVSYTHLEYGLIGGFAIIGLFLWLLLRSVRLVTRSPKTFGAILAMGLTLNIVVQAFANIAVSVQLVPATGLTFPLISMGGTSFLFTCISLGIILSVSRFVEEAYEEKKKTENLSVADESNH